jgi:hypothetical protein
VHGREWHSPRRTGRASTRAGRRTVASAPPATAAIPGLVAIGGWPPLAPTGAAHLEPTAMAVTTATGRER